MKKLALIVGHNSKAQGAVRVTDGVSEYAYYSKFADELAALAPDQYVVLHRKPSSGYSTEIDQVYGEANNLHVSATVELHFNASASPSATGTEVLTSGTRNSMILCNLMQETLTKTLRLKSRGVKQVTKQQRGGRSLWAGYSPAALIEPFFGSNRHDCETVDNLRHEFLRAVHAACLAFLARPDVR